MTKVVYMYDQTSREFKGSKTIDDDNYVVQAGETEIKPVDGLYQPVTWNGTEWVGTDKEVWEAEQDEAYQEYLKEHPEYAPQPTATEAALAALSYQQMQNQQTITKNQQEISDLQKANAQLAYQVMTTTNGGTN